MNRKIPDLPRSYMINSYGTPNKYVTGIQSALELKQVGIQSQYAFMSQECRYENVLEVERVKETRIFDRPPGEFVLIHGWDGLFGFRTRTVLGKKIDSKTYHGNPSKLNIEYSHIEYLSFEDTFNRINREDGFSQNLFMHITWGNGINLYTRCNYTNYPNFELAPGSKYLQPISGQVIYYENNEFFVAYVACSVNPNSADHVEFCVRDSLNVVDVLHGSRRLRPLFPALKKLLRVYMHEYGRSVQVEGQCRFYTYSRGEK